MSDLVMTSSRLLPLPDANVRIRPGVIGDVPFLDSLQKLHTKQVGWMPTAQFEGKIKLGHVLVAWASRPCSDGTGETPVSREEPVGYCIGNDRYFKRDDVGIIYQMNVLPGRQRGFIGAALLKAQFERSAYGCKLYCCWCAQDIAANRFWEAMGFVPLAFRAGSEKKSRAHIFWQKRIRAGDTSTPWWFPSQTSGGSIREDRIVLPIPPGTHWSDAKPLILPGQPMSGETPALPAPKAKRTKPKLAAAVRPEEIGSGGFWFAPPSPAKSEETVGATPAPKVKAKNDPRLIAAARELRDRWLEQINDTPLVEFGKYEVNRLLPTVPHPEELPLLVAA